MKTYQRVAKREREDIYVEGNDDPYGDEQYDNYGNDGDEFDDLFK